MGMDVKSVLLVGLDISEVDLRLVPGIGYSEIYDDYPEEIKHELPVTIHSDEYGSFELRLQNTDGYGNSNDELIGFKVSSTGSFGVESIENATEKIEKLFSVFKTIFNKEPRLYLITYIY